MRVAKRVSLAFVIGAPVVWGMGFNFAHPQHWDLSDIQRIEIDLHTGTERDWPGDQYAVECDGTRCLRFHRTLSEQEEIAAFDEVLGTTWDGVFPLNSIEGCPCYEINMYGDAPMSKYRILMTNTEWDVAGTTPLRMSEHLRLLFSRDR